jgi:hypothetical protein
VTLDDASCCNVTARACRAEVHRMDDIALGMRLDPFVHLDLAASFAYTRV